MERRILHIDMDAFFASVEQVLNPALKGKPLIIGGDKDDIRSVVSTASYEARKYGVHSAMPLAQARKLCPHGIYMRGNYANYQIASEKVAEVLDTVSPQVEFASIDEAYIDITGSQKLFGGDDAIAHHIKSEIFARTQLPCTIGISGNKLVSKIAADVAKPDGYLRIPPGEEAKFLRPLPVHKLPGVGPRTREMLEKLGIMTVGALADLPMETLSRVFGESCHGLKRAAEGVCTSPVETESIPKSISRETTFERDLLDWDHIESVLVYLCERAIYTLRETGMETRCVTLKVRYTDFSTHTFSRTLPEPTSVDGDILEALRGLLPKAKEHRLRVRLVGACLSSLSFNQHQLYLFGRMNSEKWERLMGSVDDIRRRYGFECIRSGKSMKLGKDVTLSTPSLSR